MVRRLQANDAHQRQCVWNRGAGPDQSQRQSAEQDITPGDPGGDGPRNGTLRAQPRVQARDLSDPALRNRLWRRGRRFRPSVIAARRILRLARSRRSGGATVGACYPVRRPFFDNAGAQHHHPHG